MIGNMPTMEDLSKEMRRNWDIKESPSYSLGAYIVLYAAFPDLDSLQSTNSERVYSLRKRAQYVEFR